MIIFNFFFVFYFFLNELEATNDVVSNLLQVGQELTSGLFHSATDSRA